MTASNRSGGHALEARGVFKRFGRVWALAGVDAEVRTGSITALVGPNAAGKTTLIKTWVGFERPTEGEVRVVGLDPWSRRGDVSERFGYVPQSARLIRGLTVDEHVTLAGLLRRGYDQQLARRRLRELAIPREARVEHLSGGQQAQVALGLALGCRAEVLLLDEPLASLDPLARREALSVLVEGNREAGSTVLLSSHTIGDIEDACDHLIVLGVGRTLLDQPVPEALALHRVADDASAPVATAASRGSVVATFPGSAGRRHLLLRVDAAGGELAGTRAPTLHEIVLGYLTAGRGAQLASEPDA